MRTTSIFYVVSALAAAAYAQDNSACDPQNNNNNDATCTSSGTSLTGRQSLVTLVTTDVNTVTSTDVGSSVFTTTLPKSIRTYTTEVPVDTTLVPVLTPSVISGTTVIETNTRRTTSAATSSAVIPNTTTATTTATTNAAVAPVVPYAIGGILAGVAALL